MSTSPIVIQEPEQLPLPPSPVQPALHNQPRRSGTRQSAARSSPAPGTPHRRGTANTSKAKQDTAASTTQQAFPQTPTRRKSRAPEPATPTRKTRSSTGSLPATPNAGERTRTGAQPADGDPLEQVPAAPTTPARRTKLHQLLDGDIPASAAPLKVNKYFFSSPAQSC